MTGREAKPYKRHMRASQSATDGAALRFLSEAFTVSSPRDLPSEATTLGRCLALALQAEVSSWLEP